MEAIVIATWKFGLPACRVAWNTLAAGGPALDAVEAGVASCEDDPEAISVGLAGLPDAAGHVTLDASIMDARGNCGAVACVRRVRNPIRVARRVMEKTPHVLLVGEDATRFAVEQGFTPVDQTTVDQTSDAAMKQYEAWKRQGTLKPEDAHDTIGMLALDASGALAGACSTSGTPFKLPGRVGDSPIIGAGMYVDGSVGAAAATGVGEESMKVCGSFAVVEAMRRGLPPREAIAEVLQRVRQRRGDADTDLSFVALRADGQAAGFSLRASTTFQYAVVTNAASKLIDSEALEAT